MKMTKEDIEEQQTLIAIKNILENRKMLNNQEVAELLRISKNLKERFSDE